MAGYTITRLEDVPDVLGDYPGRDADARRPGSTSEQVALTYRRMPQHTGGKGSYGHRHAEQEEIYFVDLGQAPVQARRRGGRVRRAGRRSGSRPRSSARSGTTSPRTPSS